MNTESFDPHRLIRDVEQRRFVRRVVIALGFASLFVIVLVTLGLAWTAMLTLFGGMLIGVLFDGVASKISAWTRCPRALALALVLLTTVGACVGGIAWLGPDLAEQATGAKDEFAEAWGQVVTWLEARPWGSRALEELNELELETLLSGSFSGMVSTTAGSVASLGLMFVFGIYFAFDPEVYIRGFTYLFPDSMRPRVRDLGASIGRALRSWLVGRFLMMAVVGLGTALGLWLIGLPLALPLGLLAGLLAFVPNLGPLLAALPGIIMGFTVDWHMALYATGVYVGVQLIEGYVLTPLIEMHVVSLPPALLIAFQLLMGLSAGIIGLFMATPLLVTLIVVIQAVYVRDILDEDVKLIGEDDDDGDDDDKQLELELAA